MAAFNIFHFLNDSRKRRLQQVFILLIILVIIIKLIVQLYYIHEIRCSDAYNQNFDFDGFDYITGSPTGCYMVPNIVHFICFGGIPIPYMDMICYLAAYKNQKPDKIYFHYNDIRTFTGKYWDILNKTPGFMDIVELHYTNMPNEIFGQRLSRNWRKYHASELTRIRILRKYGGIYLDHDVYVIHSLDDFRRYELVLGWDAETQSIGSQIIIAHKHARFLYLWLDSYRDTYRRNHWYYNIGIYPTSVYLKNPGLLHLVTDLFGIDYNPDFIRKIYKDYWSNWRYMHAIHLLPSNLYLLPDEAEELPKNFDENNIKLYNTTIKEMALNVYNPDNTN